MRWGARNWRSTAVAATASGGATTAPERNRLCPWHRRYERVSDEGDSGGREANREYNQAGHRRPIVPEISEGRVVSRIEQYRCDKERQGKLGREAERGYARKKRQQGTTEREEYRIRRSDAARSGRQDYRCNEQTKNLF